LTLLSIIFVRVNFILKILFYFFFEEIVSELIGYLKVMNF